MSEPFSITSSKRFSTALIDLCPPAGADSDSEQSLLIPNPPASADSDWELARGSFLPLTFPAQVGSTAESDRSVALGLPAERGDSQDLVVQGVAALGDNDVPLVPVMQRCT